MDWVPPMPVLNELVGFATFAAMSLDDAVEDATKYCAVFAIVRLSRRGLSIIPRGVSRVSVAVLLVAAGLALYPTLDHVADRAGDIVGEQFQPQLRSWMHIRKDPHRSDEPPCDSIMDDIVEDTTKFICVAAHYHMGQMLGGSLRNSLAQMFITLDESPFKAGLRIAADSASAIVSIGTPTSRYGRCDEYADRLSDWAQTRWEWAQWCVRSSSHPVVIWRELFPLATPHSIFTPTPSLHNATLVSHLAGASLANHAEKVA